MKKLIMLALCFGWADPAFAQEAAVSDWLTSLKPSLEALGHDAELAAICGLFGPGTTQQDVDFTLGNLPKKGLTGPDREFADNAIMWGMAGARVDFRHEQDAACRTLTAKNKAFVGSHMGTPIPDWSERRAPASGQVRKR